MDTSTVTIHTVTISKIDFATWLAANVDSLILQDVEVRSPVVHDGRQLEIVFSVSSAFLDTFLHGVINNLPQSGSYKVSVLNNDTITGIITWNT